MEICKRQLKGPKGNGDMQASLMGPKGNGDMQAARRKGNDLNI